jgi:hypothetical protein
MYGGMIFDPWGCPGSPKPSGLFGFGLTGFRDSGGIFGFFIVYLLSVVYLHLADKSPP